MTSREKTIAWCVGIAAGLFALDQALLEPYFERLTAADTAIAKHQSEMSDANTTLQVRLRAAKRWREVAADRVTGDASAAESQLLNRVREMAERAGLALNSIKSEKGEKEKGYERVVIKRAANGSMQQIARFLYELQTTDIPVRVTDLTINSRKDGLDDLAFSLTLSTIYQTPATPKVASAAAGTGAFQ